MKSIMQNNIKSEYEILLGLTTTPGSDWRGKVEEMKKFGIKKIALFPTFLGIDQRKELYLLLESIEGLEIPHVHLRNEDIEEWEMELFEKKYKTTIYNIHANRGLNEFLKKYSNKICVENHFKLLDKNQIAKLGGLCLDVQHLGRSKTEAPQAYAQVMEFLKKYPVGCCHVSPLPKLKYLLKRLFKRRGGHYMMGLSELDYARQYRQYLPKYISIELENSFEEQLKVKKYLEKNVLG